jgi:hypothetical protein
VAIGRSVRAQACEMAFGDVFFVLGLGLLLALAATRLLAKERNRSAAA